MILAILIAVLVGALAWVIFSVFPPTGPYANILAFVVALVVFLHEIGAITL